MLWAAVLFFFTLFHVKKNLETYLKLPISDDLAG